MLWHMPCFAEVITACPDHWSHLSGAQINCVTSKTALQGHTGHMSHVSHMSHGLLAWPSKLPKTSVNFIWKPGRHRGHTKLPCKAELSKPKVTKSVCVRLFRLSPQCPWSSNIAADSPQVCQRCTTSLICGVIPQWVHCSFSSSTNRSFPSSVLNSGFYRSFNHHQEGLHRSSKLSRLDHFDT